MTWREVTEICYGDNIDEDNRTSPYMLIYVKKNSVAESLVQKHLPKQPMKVLNNKKFQKETFVQNDQETEQEIGKKSFQFPISSTAWFHNFTRISKKAINNNIFQLINCGFLVLL